MKKIKIRARLIKRIFAVTFLILTTIPVAGYADTAPLLSFMGKKFNLLINGPGKLSIQSGQTKVLGKLGAKYGNFSVWKFSADKDHVLELIVGKPEDKIISVNTDGDAKKSTTPIAASPDGSLLALGREIFPDIRRLEVRSTTGEKLFSADYLDGKKYRPRWVGSDLEYVCPVKVKYEPESEAAMKCGESGQAWNVEWCAFDGVTHQVKEIVGPGAVECVH